MSDYIKRDDALNIDFKIIVSVFENRKTTATNAVQAYADAIAKIPSEDVRPVVRGKWNRTDAYPHRLYCSVCYKTYLKNDELLERWEFPLNFCPNCGAMMRKS